MLPIRRVKETNCDVPCEDKFTPVFWILYYIKNIVENKNIIIWSKSVGVSTTRSYKWFTVWKYCEQLPCSYLRPRL